MTEVQKYKYAIIFLIIVVLFLGVWLINAKTPTASTSLDSVKSALENCNNDLAAWKTENPQGATTTETQRQLATILDQCAASIK